MLKYIQEEKSKTAAAAGERELSLTVICSFKMKLKYREVESSRRKGHKEGDENER